MNVPIALTYGATINSSRCTINSGVGVDNNSLIQLIAADKVDISTPVFVL